MERFDDLTEPPVAGKFYWVRCVYGNWYGNVAWWPVMGSKHDDATHLNFPQPHYHLNRFFLHEGDLDWSVAAPIGDKHGGRGFVENDPLPAPILKRRLCRRATVNPFPVERAVTREGIFPKMYRHFAGAQCKRGNGWICPHKGFDLATVAPGPDGIITCPLHGVRINAETGVVVAS